MKLRIALILLVITLLVIVPVYAQETTTEAPATLSAVEPETHAIAGVAEESEGQAVGSGATTLVLLIGLAAVAVVGFGSLMVQNYRAPEE